LTHPHINKIKVICGIPAGKIAANFARRVKFWAICAILQSAMIVKFAALG
jgi:hypothetical protein